MPKDGRRFLLVTPGEALAVLMIQHQCEIGPGVYDEQTFCKWMKKRFGVDPGEYTLKVHCA